MKSIPCPALAMLCVLVVSLNVTGAGEWQMALRWSKLAPLPDKEGFAGSFAGVSGGTLLVAGGANFPDKKPWEGGAKVWHDMVFVLEKPDGAWRRGGVLPRPLGYGAAVSHRRGLVCIGGSDAQEHHGTVTVLKWNGRSMESETLAALPEPRANLCGALIGDTVFVCGGSATPDATNAVSAFYSLNLSEQKPDWRTLEPVPGPGRMFSVAGAYEGSFYLFGGTALRSGADGKPVREWLRDAWCYTPDRGWKRLANLPRMVVAAPSPAPVVNGRFLIFGGDDGLQVSTAPTEHKGFPRDALAYDPAGDKWERAGELPFALVATSTVEWKKRLVIPGGEIRPGTRSTEVWAMPVK